MSTRTSVTIIASVYSLANSCNTLERCTELSFGSFLTRSSVKASLQLSTCSRGLLTSSKLDYQVAVSTSPSAAGIAKPRAGTELLEPQLPVFDRPPPLAMATDQEIIARASSGLALCGMYVGESDEKVGRKKAVKKLLRPPEQCELTNSVQMYEAWGHKCCNIQANESFREEVKNFGWSVALRLHANVCGFDLNAFEGGLGRRTSTQTSLLSQEMTKEACLMQIWYCPKASFAIPLHQMQLSEEALNDARRVQNSSDAVKFLSDYNSHVSTGKYHVGGVLMKTIEMKARTSTSLQNMLEKVSKNATLGAGVGFGLCTAGGQVGFTNEKGSSSTEQQASHQGTVSYVYAALGPRTDEEVEFKTRLNEKSTWDIIDKIDNPDLVPVWDIPSVKNAEDLQPCCTLLREAWQKSVKSKAGELTQGIIYSLLQSSYMEHVKSLLAVSSTSQDLEEQKKALRKIWLVKTDNLDKSRTRDLFYLGKFRELLDRLSEAEEIGSLDCGRALVRSIITRDEQAWLKREGIHLSNSVEALLRNEVQPVGPLLPPLEDMSPGGLVDRLKALLGRSSSDAVTAFDPNAVAKAIKDFFRQNLRDGNPVGGVRGLVRIHGFDENGEIRDMTHLTREEMNVLVDELESMTRGSQNPTPTDLSEDKDVVRIAWSIVRRNICLDDFATSSNLATGYNRRILEDRPKAISDDPQRQMLDRIKHRLEPFASTSSEPADVSELEDYFGDTPVNNGDDIHEAFERSTPKSSPLGILADLLTSSDLVVQRALLQLLLDARIAIPLVVQLKERTGENSYFRHLAEALDFVRVKLAKQEILSIAGDIKLPRVVFISNRQSSLRETSQMASKVMNFQLPSQFFKGDTGDGISVIELGIGFLQISKNDSQDHKPCLVFCVWGYHHRLGEFLAKVADFIIVEMDPSEHASSLSWIVGQSKKHILYWKIDPSNHNFKKEPHWTFWGSFQKIAEDIERYLVQGIVKHQLFKGASAGGAETLEQCLTSIPSLNERPSISNLSDLQGIKIEKAKESLKLQKNFAADAGFYFESLRQKADKPEHDSKRLTLQNERKQLSPEVLKLPLIQIFISILSLTDYVERNIGIVNLELNIEKMLHSTLKEAFEKETEAFQKFQQNADDGEWQGELENNYICARREHVEKKLGLEHLWRELSHIFVANPQLKFLPLLAAQHLIDGFPLEILDGDANMFNKLWVESILVQLNMVLSASLKCGPKVFVLSVIGVQSSGKSTLLNIMFGTKLKTSAGQCTHGVYLQLIKSERKEFDYVLILDTEGIRSPEFYCTPNAEAHDNRLATFAILPADACIVMVANEDDNGLKEVLPMVMLALKGSAAAEESAGRRQAKLIFAYRSVDTNDVGKLERNQTKLQEDLRSASEDLQNVPSKASRQSSRSNYVVDTLLKDFHVSTKEDKSDVKYFGNLKTGNVPPKDTPDWDYGRKVERLREYIHKRVTDDIHWRAYELNSWARHLNLVWDCMADANFELSFRSRMEYLQFQELQDKLVASRQKVSKNWMEESEKLAGDLQLRRGIDAGLDRSFEQFWKKLKLTVQTMVDESAEEVEVILEKPQWQKWKVEELVNWNKFCSAQEEDWQWRLKDYMDAIFKFDDAVKDYYAKIQMEIENKTRNFNMKSPQRQKNMESEFDQIFQRILCEAQSEHPPMAERVPSQVTRVYQKSKIGRKMSFDTVEEGSAQGSDNNSEESSEYWWWSRGEGISKSSAQYRKHMVIALLESKLEGCLCNIKQYADHVVEEMILSTDKSVEKENLSREDQGKIHRHVKKLLTEKLHTIQEKWDKNYNVSKLLAERKKGLLQFFQNCANRVDGTKMLFTEINHLFRSKLMDDCFRSKLSNDVSNKLLNDAWAGNWIVLRAHLDLHLVELIEASNTDELLKCVENGASHYKIVVDSLIEKEIRRLVEDHRLWESFLNSIQRAVQSAALRGSRSESGSSKISEFLNNLVESINDIGAGSLELSRNISNYVNAEVYSKYGDVLDFEKLVDDVCQGLKTIKPDLTSSSIQEVVKLVTERMKNFATDNVGPRCTEMCPRCRLTCFRQMDHPGDHDTLHQPSGLSGAYFKETGALSPYSCSEIIALKDWKFGIWTNGTWTWVPFADWRKHYPEWKVPTEGSLGTVHVREYIFAHYQEELVERHSTKKNPLKIRSKIPPRFLLHEIGASRCQLESIIASA